MTPVGSQLTSTVRVASSGATAGAKASTARMLDEARMPPRYRRCDLETFVTYPTRSCYGAVKQAQPLRRRVSGDRQRAVPDRPARHRQDASRRRGAAARHHDARRARPVLRHPRSPARDPQHLQPDWCKTAEMDILRPVMEADLLVLDDLGSEKTSEWVEETMNLIVNTRYNERRHTIFTSNYEDTPDDNDPELPQGADRLPHPFAPARDVRVPRVRRRRLSPPAAQRRRRRSGGDVEGEAEPPDAAGATKGAGSRASCKPAGPARRDLGWTGGQGRKLIAWQLTAES